MKRISIVVLLFVLILVVSCSREEQPDDTQNGEHYIYVIDNQETKLIRQSYTPKETTVLKQIEEYLVQLTLQPYDISNKKAIPDNVTKPTFQYMADKKLLRVIFDSTYSLLSGIQELLRRAAIVKTLCQVEGVEYVEFYIGEQVLTREDGLAIRMNASSFIDNFGENSYNLVQRVTLYYANEKGNKLIGINANMTYDGKSALEKLIVNQIIKGPDEIIDLPTPVYGTIHPDTQVLKISVSNGVCYVNFSKEFLVREKKVKDEVALYSVVNSLMDLKTINSVQIQVEGEPLKNFGKLTELPEQLTYNFDVTSD